MKKLVLFVVAFVSVSVATAQKKKGWGNLADRTGDHIMLQLSYDSWMGVPDSIKKHMKGFPRGANLAVMLDKRFKGAPQFSVAFGVGVGTSSMYFTKYDIELKSNNAKLPFTNLNNLNHFKKYKLATAYLEIPLELRYTFDPVNERKSIKAAIGIKVGTMINAHTKGKTLQDNNDKTLYSYTEKESSSHFFNSTRIAATARVGYGNFSVFGSYQVNNLFKDGVAPPVKLLQIGLCISGL